MTGRNTVVIPLSICSSLAAHIKPVVLTSSESRSQEKRTGRQGLRKKNNK